MGFTNGLTYVRKRTNDYYTAEVGTHISIHCTIFVLCDNSLNAER